jgi:hypothetical protein
LEGVAVDAESVLEGLVDEVGLASLLGSLAEVCRAKADHVASAWQDYELARQWRKAGAVLERTADRVEGVDVR